MKKIRTYRSLKYASSDYVEIASGIFQHSNHYVATLAFEQEPSLGEGNSAENISQYPLEDILDQFDVNISDFYPTLNTSDSVTCYIEFSSRKLERIESLLSIVGKHVYNKEVCENGKAYSVLAIE